MGSLEASVFKRVDPFKNQLTGVGLPHPQWNNLFQVAKGPGYGQGISSTLDAIKNTAELNFGGASHDIQGIVLAAGVITFVKVAEIVPKNEVFKAVLSEISWKNLKLF